MRFSPDRLLVVSLVLVASLAHADDRTELARRTCNVLETAVSSVRSAGPLLLSSYRPSPAESLEFVALRDVAFTYDNAVASIALFACGRPAAARRIADALVLAVSGDPAYHDGRIRNAYKAGPISGPTMSLAGYWSAERNLWIQDAYQVSVATGNAAWAALALLEAYRRTRHAPYLDAATRALGWIATNTFDGNAPAGFVGGYFDARPDPVRQGWKSTEQNVDLAAAWSALDRLAPDGDAKARAAIAAAFVASRWNAREGRFLIGTGVDGRTADDGHSGLDAQIWPLIAMPRVDPDWMRVLAFVEAGHGVAGGYGYMWHPDGIWTEGTAQVAAVFVLCRLPQRAAPLWPLLRKQQTPDGWLFATPLARVRTGLAIGPNAVTDDFFYYHLPHLGATAWAALAARGVNPFGER